MYSRKQLIALNALEIVYTANTTDTQITVF